MKKIDLSLGIGSILLLGALAACQPARHRTIEAKPGSLVICRLCYKDLTTYKDRTTDRGHQCPECRTEMSIYVENGVRKIKCAKCAPEGFDCDRCLPSHVFEEEKF